jgi:hypothetical protein
MKARVGSVRLRAVVFRRAEVRVFGQWNRRRERGGPVAEYRMSEGPRGIN